MAPCVGQSSLMQQTTVLWSTVNIMCKPCWRLARLFLQLDPTPILSSHFMLNQVFKTVCWRYHKNLGLHITLINDTLTPQNPNKWYYGNVWMQLTTITTTKPISVWATEKDPTNLGFIRPQALHIMMKLCVPDLINSNWEVGKNLATRSKNPDYHWTEGNRYRKWNVSYYLEVIWNFISQIWQLKSY